MIVEALKDLEAILKQNYSPKPDLTERLKQCLYYEQDNKWELCTVCHEIKHQREWERQGYKTLRQYLNDLRATGYQINQKTFSEFVRIRELILRHNIQREFFLEVGYSKFRELLKFMDKVTNDQMLDLITKLPFMSVRELRRKKNELLGTEKISNKDNYEYTKESISDEDVEKLTGGNYIEKMKGEDATCEDTSWGVEYAPNMKFYSFDAFGNEISIVEKALNISKKLSEIQQNKSAYFVFVFQKFVELYEKGLIN